MTVESVSGDGSNGSNSMDREALLHEKLLAEFTEYSVMMPPSSEMDTDNVNTSFANRESLVRLEMSLRNVMLNGHQNLDDKQLDAVAFYLGWFKTAALRNQPFNQPEDISIALHVLEVLGLDMSKQRTELQHVVQTLSTAESDK